MTWGPPVIKFLHMCMGKSLRESVWLKGVYLPQRHECWSPQVICIVWWFCWIFQWGERPRMESPKWLQIFGQAFWCKKVWGMETPLVIDQAWAGLPRLVAAQEKLEYNQSSSNNSSNIFCLPLLSYKWKTFQSWQFLFMNLSLANVQVDFKKCPSKPGFANDLRFSSPKFILKITT